MRTTNKMANMDEEERKAYYREKFKKSYDKDNLSKYKTHIRQIKFRNKHNPKIIEIANNKEIDIINKLNLLKKIVLEEKIIKLNQQKNMMDKLELKNN